MRDPTSTVLYAPKVNGQDLRKALARNRAHVANRTRNDNEYFVSDQNCGEKITEIYRLQSIAFDCVPPALSPRWQGDIDVSFEDAPHQVGDILMVKGSDHIVEIFHALKSLRVGCQFAEYNVDKDTGVPSCKFFIMYKGDQLKPPMKQLVTCIITYNLKTNWF